MFDRKSDAALNKHDPDAIVYRSVKDVHIRLTPGDFSSPAEFKKWKKWSDEDYCQMEHTSAGTQSAILWMKNVIPKEVSLWKIW